MNILLDTDVVLDLIFARDPFVVEASAIWLAKEQGRCTAFISPITPINVFYITRRSHGLAIARQAVRDLIAGLKITALTQDELRAAELLPMTDFEDAVQVTAALAANCTAIITRNGADYANAPLSALSPATFLAQLSTLPDSSKAP